MNEEQNIDDSSQRADDSSQLTDDRKNDDNNPGASVNSQLTTVNALVDDSSHLTDDRKNDDNNGESAEELQTTHYKPQTNFMEVHHHPHVEKKNFKEYLLEGLMIFVAVSLGFIAENIREYLGDKSKEKEYVINIKKDLAADTSSLNIWIPTLYKRVGDFDTLIYLLQNAATTTRGSDMYYFGRLATRARVFTANDNTIVELKNSGNFRLITSKAVINGITDFEKLINSYLNLNAVENKECEMLYPLLGNLFDAGIFNTMIKASYKTSTFSVDSITASLVMENLLKPAGNPKLRNYNADNINQLIFYLHERKTSFIGEIRLLAQQKKSTIALIELINREYHLKDE